MVERLIGALTCGDIPARFGSGISSGRELLFRFVVHVAALLPSAGRMPDYCHMARGLSVP
jgi:hypothetical protein